MWRRYMHVPVRNPRDPLGMLAKSGGGMGGPAPSYAAPISRGHSSSGPSSMGKSGTGFASSKQKIRQACACESCVERILCISQTYARGNRVLLRGALTRSDS